MNNLGNKRQTGDKWRTRFQSYQNYVGKELGTNRIQMKRPQKQIGHKRDKKPRERPAGAVEKVGRQVKTNQKALRSKWKTGEQVRDKCKTNATPAKKNGR